MKTLIFTTLLVFSHVVATIVLPQDLPLGWEWDPEINMNVVSSLTITQSEIIRHWGYGVEEHETTTADGYILSLQRVLARRGRGMWRNSTEKRPVVFFQHGLEASSTNWVTNLPNQSAAYIFADHGCDVWLGNVRGNVYSRRHRWLSPHSKPYWLFSWDKMAKYDLEAMINYALNVSRQRRLYYVGHSQGSLIGFAKFSQDPKFAKKIIKFFALGPVVTVGHIQGYLRFLAHFTPELHNFFTLFGQYEFMPPEWLNRLAAKFVCGWAYTNPLCENILFLIGGPNSHQMNATRIAVYAAHNPAGTSTQNMVHFAQMVLSGNFQMYDYGSARANRFKYNQTTPPLYKLDKMNVPTHLFWGDLDSLSTPQDVEYITRRLPKLEGNHRLRLFNHVDFIWGLRAPNSIYEPILDVIRRHERTL